MGIKNKINVCLSPALLPFYDCQNSIAIIVDIFRATTSMCTAFSNGATAIKTVSTIEEAIDYKKKGTLVAAERHTQKCDFADFGNSPFDFTEDKVKGQTIVFTTTNGTKAVEKALCYDGIVIGAFSNITVLAEHCIAQDKNIMIVCSGWNNQFCIEDTLYAGALVEKLITRKAYNERTDGAIAALKLWHSAKIDLISCIKKTEHYKRLEENGLQASIEYCLTSDIAPVVPMYDKTEKTFRIH